MMSSTAPRGLLLIHQIPPKPAYFRAKVGKRLAKLGAVAIKNSVYVVPSSEQTHKDMQWVARGIVAEGGDATMSVRATRRSPARSCSDMYDAEFTHVDDACTFEVLLDS